jgi:hypothetical protein
MLRITPMRWDRSLAGTSMSELLGLGVADAESRWIGVRRHQAILIIMGLGLLGHWLTSSAPLVEAFVGVACLACAAPTSDGLTVGERTYIGLHFVGRSRWTSIRVRLSADVMTVGARGEVSLRGFELSTTVADLTFRVATATTPVGLASFADALATSDATRHFSMHVLARRGDVVDASRLPEDVSAPAGWTLCTTLATTCVATTRARVDAGAMGVRANLGPAHPSAADS